jgi:SHS2 domain-containing protein
VKEGRVAFYEIEHTSEIGFIAEGETLEEIFADAAKALVEVMTDTGKVKETLQRPVSLEAEDLPQLMHAWLEELNFLSQTEHEFYSRFEVNVEDNRLTATLWGEKIDLERHELRLEVKAVTYGDFYFRKTAEGKWQTRVIIDV